MKQWPDLDKVLALTEVERACIAGFFDGEGSVSLNISQSKKQDVSDVRLVVSIGQKRGSVLKWLHELFGGSLFLRVRNDRGYSTRDGTIGVWSITNSDSLRIFYRTVKPYLRLKAEELDMAMESYNNPDVTIEEVEAVIENIRELRSVGEKYD